MLRFPQLVRWLKWDTENKNGIAINATDKAKLIDNAIAEFIQQEKKEDSYKYWYDLDFLSASKNHQKPLELL